MRIETLFRSLLFVGLTTSVAGAQNAPPAKPGTSCRPPGFFTAPARYPSAEVLSDRRVTFRLCAPEATEAMVTSSDYQPGHSARIRRTARSGDGEGHEWAVERDDVGAVRAGHVPVQLPSRRRARARSAGDAILARASRHEQRARGAGDRRRVPGVRPEDPARRGVHGGVLVDDARRQAPRARVLAAGLHEGLGALPRALSRPRRRRQ